MEIDENFEGLKKVGNIYCYEGDLFLNESVDIKINLDVKGNLDVKSNLGVNGYLYVRGNINIGGYLYVGGYLDVGGDLYVSGNIDIGENKIISGIKTEILYTINSFMWSICVMDNHIRIGCEFHSRDEWRNFTDSEISKMSIFALEFWKENKERILNFK